MSVNLEGVKNTLCIGQFWVKVRWELLQYTGKREIGQKKHSIQVKPHLERRKAAQRTGDGEAELGAKTMA